MTRSDVLALRDEHLLAKANKQDYSEAVLQACYMWLDADDNLLQKAAKYVKVGFVELSQPKED